jgi:hypothetical protein
MHPACLLGFRETNSRHPVTTYAQVRICAGPHGRRQDLSSWGSRLIIVSESSAEAARRVRTGRYTPVRSRSSAARKDTPRYANVRRISVHTEEHTRSEIKTIHASGGPRLQDGPKTGHEGGG